MGIFRFRHLWHVPADPETTFEALADVDRYPLWWPQIRGIRRIDDDCGHAYVRSMLPYTLDLLLTREVEDAEAGILRVRLGGDLEGWSEFRVSAAPSSVHHGSYAGDAAYAADDGPYAADAASAADTGDAGHAHDPVPTMATIADYRQEATVTAAGLEHFVPLARPLLTLNHRWMMGAGERGLAQWLRSGGSL